MGDFKEHVLFGFLTASVFAYFMKHNINMGLSESIVTSASIFLGSVLPDVDHKKAYVHRAVKSFLSITPGMLCIFFLPFQIHYNFAVGVLMFGVIYTVISRAKIRHRGFTHSFSFLVIVASLGVILSVYLFSSPVPGLAGGLGILSHLILDGELKMT